MNIHENEEICTNRPTGDGVRNDE